MTKALTKPALERSRAEPQVEPRTEMELLESQLESNAIATTLASPVVLTNHMDTL